MQLQIRIRLDGTAALRAHNIHTGPTVWVSTRMKLSRRKISCCLPSYRIGSTEMIEIKITEKTKLKKAFNLRCTCIYFVLSFDFGFVEKNLSKKENGKKIDFFF